MSLVLALLGALRASLRTRSDLALENLALRQQLALLPADRSDRNSGASIVSSGCGSPCASPEFVRARTIDVSAGGVNARAVMIRGFLLAIGALRAVFLSHAELVLENLALRQQLAAFARNGQSDNYSDSTSPTITTTEPILPLPSRLPMGVDHWRRAKPTPPSWPYLDLADCIIATTLRREVPASFGN